jgi:hypothetical protein
MDSKNFFETFKNLVTHLKQVMKLEDKTYNLAFLFITWVLCAMQMVFDNLLDTFCTRRWSEIITLLVTKRQKKKITHIFTSNFVSFAGDIFSSN